MKATLLAMLLALVLTPAPSGAGDDVASGDAPFPLRVKVGELALICATGTIQCPAGAAVCDRPSIAAPEVTPRDGLGFRGVAPGETLCSAGAGSGHGLRRVYRVVVTD